MLRFLAVLCLTFALAGCPGPTARTTYERGAYTSPAPARTFTPTGAGASHGGLAAPQHGSVLAAPRSPNKRALPASGEAGLWAADEIVAADRERLPPKFLDILLPIPPPGGHTQMRMSKLCGAFMGQHLLSRKLIQVAMSLHPDVRRCLAARLYQHCAQASLDKYMAGVANVEYVNKALERDAKAYTETAGKFRREACTGQPQSDDADRLFNLLAPLWTDALTHVTPK